LLCHSAKIPDQFQVRTFLDEYDKVMTENFAERFVNHRNVGLATKPVSEFPLHHGERRFHVTALVIVLQELITPELEVVTHLLPRSAAIPAMMRRERNIRHGSHGSDRLHVRPTRVSLVCGNFRDLKVLRCAVNQSREQLGIVCVSTVNLDCRNDIGFSADHQVTFDPIVLLPNLPILVVKPASESASSEALEVIRGREPSYLKYGSRKDEGSSCAGL
jgi:hypothetical protein